jgi:hypothetical protein
VFVAFIVANIVFSFWVAYVYGQSSPAFDWNVQDPLHRVRGVTPGSEAARAGVRAGDRIDVDAMTNADRHRAAIGWTGRSVRYAMVDARGNHYSVNLHRREDVPRGWVFYDWFFAISGAVVMLVSAVILWRRPGPMTVAFAFWTCGSMTFANKTALVVSAGLPDGLYEAVSSAIFVLFGPLPVIALLPFLARFPWGVVHGTRLMVARAADATFALAALLMYAFMLRGFPPAVRTVEAPLAATFAGVALLVGSALLYARSGGDERRRVTWVLLGLLGSAVGYGFIATPYNTPSHPLTLSLIWLSYMVFPFTVFYAVLRHRLIDPTFALNRAVVYGAVTALVVAAISLVDFAVGRFFAESKLALAVEALAAVVIGFGLNWVHAGTERLVERTLFRERHRVEAQLDARIVALDYAGETATVDASLITDAARLMKLGSDALFVRESGADRFVRQADVGWHPGDVRTIECESFLVRSLIATEQTVVLDSLGEIWPGFPPGERAPDLAVPVNIGHDLRALALYGKREGTAPLDPEERRLLERLVRAAAAAYERIDAAAWRRRAESLEASLLPSPSAP